MVSTETIRTDLAARGFHNIVAWTRGVDLDVFTPRQPGSTADDAARPIFIYVGRVAVEKNIKAVLKLDLPGAKWVVGGGPILEKLKARYPDVRFTGHKHGEELAALYRAADVFVFPSRTDTFGLALLEALASGVPVAAYPEPGPLDVIGTSRTGALDDDLDRAIARALEIPRQRCRAHAETFSWRSSALQFLANLKPAATPITAEAAE
jgi:glycosyltransferase involved in cell wall biosynthesis